MTGSLAPAGRTCTICGRLPIGRYTVSLSDEVTCAAHTVMVRCVFCLRPGLEPEPPGWKPFAGTRQRCPTCVEEAVETQQQARVHLPEIRRHMAEIGVVLPQPVRVRIVAAEDATALAGSPVSGFLLGLTEQEIGSARRTARIQIVAGLPPLLFGRAVAHEIGHAWLGLHSQVRAQAAVEEGLCELFAYAWLKRHPDRMAQVLRERIKTNPDPVYGGGFRTVYESVQRHGVTAVLQTLMRTGVLL